MTAGQPDRAATARIDEALCAAIRAEARAMAAVELAAEGVWLSPAQVASLEIGINTALTAAVLVLQRTGRLPEGDIR